MKKIFFLIIISSINLHAQTAVESGLSFLKFGFGARNVAMSDLGVVANNDLSALYYNPALLAVNKKTQLSFTHNSLFQDLNSEMFAGSFSAFGVPLAIGVNTTSVSNIEVRTGPGNPESSFNANYFFASISSAYEISEHIAVGASIKYLYENIFSDKSNGLAFDIGVSYTKLIAGLDFGASIRNIGSMNKLRNEPTKLPTDLRLGGSYEFAITDYDLQFTALAGIQKYLSEDEIHLHLGGETLYNKIIALRLGYVSNYYSKNFSAGFGIIWKGINFDYAFVPVKYGLGDSHIITILYTF